MAGASAVQVGTANFADPAVTADILGGISRWCGANGVDHVRELTGVAHR